MSGDCSYLAVGPSQTWIQLATVDRVMKRSTRLALPRTLAVLGGTVGGLTIAFYLWVITNEDDNSLGQVVGSAVIMAIPCVLAFASVALSARAARRMLTAAAIIFGFLGFLSVGPGFLLAAVLTAIAAERTVDSMTPTQ